MHPPGNNPAGVRPRTWRGQIFRRYARAIVGVVAGVLLISSSLNIYFSYERIRGELSRLQQEKARNAAATVSTFVGQIDTQLTAASREVGLDTTPQQIQVTLRRLLRLAPEITEATYLDSVGKEQVAVSRLETDRLLTGTDRSSEEAYREAGRDEPWFSSVYFQNESEPHMAVALRLPSASGGVLLADVNLTFVQEVVLGLDLQSGGYAFVADANGLLIAHPDLSLVLRKTELRRLKHVKDALASLATASRPSTVERSLDGTSVFSAHHDVEPTGWVVFVEQPVSQAFARLREHLLRTVAVFVLGLILAVLTSVFLARRLTRPVNALHHAASAIGAGDLDFQVDVKTGDELEELGREFDLMRQELRARLEDLRASRRRLVEAQDEERRRMERDIHDGAQQQLVAVSIKLGLVKNLLQRDPARAGSILEEVAGESSEALDTLRDLARGLYPPTLRDEGLAAAIESHVGRIPAEVSFDDGTLRGVRFPQEIEGQIYFCVREALQNATKYAGSAPIRVTLSRTETHLEFAVIDQGPGFDVETVRRGAGLQNISDRLETLGGELVISSSGSGSTVGGSVPLSD